jgi:hypothetical protein
MKFISQERRVRLREESESWVTGATGHHVKEGGIKEDKVVYKERERNSRKKGNDTTLQYNFLRWKKFSDKLATVHLPPVGNSQVDFQFSIVQSISKLTVDHFRSDKKLFTYTSVSEKVLGH